MLVSKKFKNKIILDNIDLNIEKNTINLLLGENGSGKTTLFKILANLISNNSLSLNEYKTSLLVDKDILFSDKTGFENLEYFLDKEELKAAKKYIEYFNVSEYINDYVKTYSNGMRKKVELIVAFSRKSNILLLDEPTNSLDVKNNELLKKIIKEECLNKTIIISSHDKSIYDKNIVDNIFVLKDHKINVLYKNTLDFMIYKVKTIKEVDILDIEIIKKTSDCIFVKVHNKPDKIINKFIPYGVIEFSPVELCDEIYLKEIIW